MRAGERCRTFRRLPAKRFTVSTLVQDACLRIPNETTIEVQEGATLAIIATNGLSLGTQVVFNARGARGLRGNRAQFASIYLDASTDQEIRALCVDEGNRCACPTGNPALSSIRGRAGGPGAPGGTLHLISPELVSAPRVTGLGMDVSGGTGGPAGESGTRECTRGAVQCASPACSAGVGSGPDGADGSVFLSLGGEGSAGAVQRMMLTTTPPRAVVIVPLEVDAALREQFKKLEDQAIKEGWQRRSGEDI
jgi:hypothetical protein